MLPKPVRKLVFILLLIAFGYYAYNMVRVHTSHEVIAFKQFSSALMENDRMAAKKLVVGARQLEPFSKRAKRDEALRGMCAGLTTRFVTFAGVKMERQVHCG